MVAIGSTISHYRVLDEIGRGGMGVVYRAVDTRLGREIALKFLPDEVAGNAAALARFRREARAASALNHPNICTLYDVGEHEGRHFIAMELMRGQSLAERLAAGPLPMDEVRRLGVQLAGALEVSHAQGIVHRDIKPGNIFITERGDAKILDFGLAKAARQLESSTTGLTLEADLTTERGLVGTPSYMSPEQALGRPLGGRSDLFSLGAVLYCMATGRRPFEAESLPAILDAVLHRDPTPVTTINPSAPAALDRLIRRCLAKDPAARYRDARELREDLERIVPPGSPWRWWRLRSLRSPGRRTVVLAGVVVAVAIVAAAVVVLRRGEARSTTAVSDSGSGLTAASPLLAVLPFSNQTGNAGSDHVGEALGAGLLADLGQITGLRLVAPVAVRGAGAEDVGVEARRLGAQLLLGGEIQDELGRLRINARIVEASSGVVMWSHVSRAESANLFHLQREIARGVTDFLSIPMSPAERRRLTQDGPSSLEAFARYVEGRRLMMMEGPERAVDLFAQAVAGDPNFALALAALGEAQWTIYERTKAPERLRAAQEAVARARVLDAELPQTILVGMLVDASSGRLETGEQMDRALSRHPRPAEASRLLSASYEVAGNLDDAERLLRSATALDPQDWFNWTWLGVFLLRHRDAYQALGALERADALAPPEVWQPHAYLGIAALQQGRYEDAIALLEDLPGPIVDAAAAANLATAYYYSQRPDKWERAEEHYRAALRLSPERAVYHGNLADLHAELGRTGEAIAGYRRAMELSRVETEANPGDRGARLHLALYAAKAEECPLALDQAREAWNQRPESSGELHEIALVFAVCRERGEALEALAVAVERGLPAEILSAEAELEWLREDPLFPRPEAADAPRGGRQ